MRLAFLGSPEAAVQPLRALAADGHDIAVVVTRADKRRGRGGQIVPTPVKQAAAELGLPVAHEVDAVLGKGIELGVVVAFGRIIKPHVLAEVPMVNLHFSLLPRWRGAAPVERAILAGDTETGVCLMQLEEGLDTGPVHECARTAIDGAETADELRSRLVGIGTEILVRRLRDGLGEPTPQQGEPTYAEKLQPDELRLDWSRPAAELNRFVRVGPAWTTFRDRRLIVTQARPAAEGPDPGTIDGVVVGAGEGTGLELVEVKPEAKQAMPASAWRNGAQPKPGERFE